MNPWITSAIERAETINDALSEKRSTSLQKLKNQPWPTRKTEDWKYTSLNALASYNGHPAKSHSAVSDNNDSNSVARNSEAEIDDFESIDIVFVDGVLQTDISLLDQIQGLTVSTLASISPASESLFSAIKPDSHYFGLVNDALAQQGVVLSIDENATIAKPLRILHQYSAPTESHHRHLVRVGKNAKVTLVEQFSGRHKSVATQFVEVDLSEASDCTYYRFGLQSDEAVSVGGSHFRLSAAAKLHATIVGNGSEISRLNIDVLHVGEKTEAILNAIYLLKDKATFDLHSNIEHCVPNGTTTENVRGIVGDHAHAVFNGRIHIHRGAQKTLAELNNRNLLLSRTAEVDTKPELEIYADDVRCAHGATIAELDERAIYYLATRGIDEQSAKVMLNFGFINELIDQMPHEVLAVWLQKQLRARFEKMQQQQPTQQHPSK